MRHHDWMVGLALLVAASGCVLAPRAARDERTALARAGEPYRDPFPDRALPTIPDAPTWRDVLARALAANGEIEAAYFAWAAAVHRIERAGAYPNTALSLDVSRALSGGGGFDGTSLTLGFDPMENLAFPTKVYQAAKVATAEAQAAGRRLVALRFDVQRRVRHEWLDYALAAERLRLARERASLLALRARTAAARVAGGATRADFLQAERARQLADSEVATLAAELPQRRARLNALMDREVDAPLAAPSALEPARPLGRDDAALLALAAAHDPSSPRSRTTSAAGATRSHWRASSTSPTSIRSSAPTAWRRNSPASSCRFRRCCARSAR